MSNRKLDIKQSRTQARAVLNFERNLSSVVLSADLDTFKPFWLYLRHTPQMQPFLRSRWATRISAAIEHFGDMGAFEIEGDNYHSHYLLQEPSSKLYMGHTETIFPCKPLLVDAIFRKKKGKVRAALETAVGMLLNIGCENFNSIAGSVFYGNETEVEPTPMPSLQHDENAFNELAQGTDELADFLRLCREVHKAGHIEEWNSGAEEIIEPYQQYIIVYKHYSDADGWIEGNNQSGFPLIPIGKMSVIDNNNGMVVSMPHINLEKYLMKIFQFNFKTLSYDL